MCAIPSTYTSSLKSGCIILGIIAVSCLFCVACGALFFTFERRLQAPTSDAAGHEIDYHFIQDTIDANDTLTGRMWDESVQSPWYNYKSTVDGKIHQRWFDDPDSLRMK